MLNDELLHQLGVQLYELRENRSEDHPPAQDLNDLIADLMNGLETLFILVNARASQESKPQTKRAIFVSTSNPDKPKVV